MDVHVDSRALHHLLLVPGRDLFGRVKVLGLLSDNSDRSLLLRGHSNRCLCSLSLLSCLAGAVRMSARRGQPANRRLHVDRHWLLTESEHENPVTSVVKLHLLLSVGQLLLKPHACHVLFKIHDCSLVPSLLKLID